jgi:hypothetical protein
MTSVSITDGVCTSLLNDVRTWGARGVETGGFLLAHPNGPISILALAGNGGVARRRGLFSVSPRALARLFSWAGDRDLHVAAQAHSHGGRAFLSETDLRHGFSVAGFTTTVIPYFAAPPDDPRRWGWWRYEGEWREAEAPAVISGNASVIRFDEEGIDER